MCRSKRCISTAEIALCLELRAYMSGRYLGQKKSDTYEGIARTRYERKLLLL